MNRLIVVCVILIIYTCKGTGSASPNNPDFEMLRKKSNRPGNGWAGK